MAHSTVNQTLFVELNKYCQNRDYEKALKSANKILSTGFDDKAFQCKVVCHIHLSEYDKALQSIAKNVKTEESMCFEKAYCLYRQNKTKEAYAVLKDIQNPTLREKELLAQILYRLEKYEDCHDLYLDLIKNFSDDFEEERKTNLAAVYANLYMEKSTKCPSFPPLKESTFELAYNKATIFLAQEKYIEALDQLKKAEEIYKKSCEEEEETNEEEIETELAILRTQQGYLYQRLGKAEEALKLYNQVLKLRPTDPTTTAVAANNVITINKDQNMFDSKKKMKLATAEGASAKMTTRQKFGVAFNHCLLLLFTNHLEGCRNSLNQMASRFPNYQTPLLLILQAALLVREKQTARAISLLQEYCDNNPPHQCLPIAFTLVQLLLTQGQISQACKVLKNLGDISYSPGVVSSLVSLYQSQGDLGSALETLRNSIQWYKQNNPKSPILTMLIRSSGELYLRNHQPKEAAQLWEELRRIDSEDPRILAHLISAYSQYDPEKAKAVSKELPPLDSLCGSIDVDQLESGSWAMGATKYIRRAAKSATAIEPDLTQKKKSKKKRKKGKLPKNYDPNIDPDPERWLPKHERTTYKKRKDRRAGGGVGKGTQGATAAEMESLSKATVPAAKPITPQPSPAQGPRNKAPINKKKKKRGGKF